MRTRSEHGAVRRYAVEFDNLLEVTAYLRNTPRTRHDMDSSQRMASPDWDLGVGYEGAVKLAESGWQEGRDLLYKLNATVPPLGRGFKRIADFAGDYPDVGRFVAGDPMCMVRKGKREGRAPVITLVVGTTASWQMSAQSMLMYGAAMLSVIDTLENNGRRVEVIAGYITRSLVRDNEFQAFTWSVKAAEDPVDIASLAFSVAHPAASRRIGFAIAERSPWRMTGGSGYGNAYHVPTTADLVDPSNKVIVLKGAGMSFSKSVPDAIAALMNEINLAAGETIVEAA